MKVRKQLQTITVKEIDVNIGVVKNPSAISVWQELEKRPEVTINGFRS